MNNDTEKANNIIRSLKKLLFNYDLWIGIAYEEIKLKEDIIDAFKHSKQKKKRNACINARIDKERYERFISELQNRKNELKENIEIIFDAYHPRYKKVFVGIVFECKTYNQLAEELNYSVDTIKKMVSTIKSEILNYYDI